MLVSEYVHESDTESEYCFKKKKKVPGNVLKKLADNFLNSSNNVGVCFLFVTVWSLATYLP